MRNFWTPLKLTLTIVAILIINSVTFATSVLEPSDEMQKMANAYIEDNQIPWYCFGDYDDVVIGQLKEIKPLTKTIIGNCHYSLHLAEFHNLKTTDGKDLNYELKFFINKKFPTKESGIQAKLLWPFQENRVLTFKIKKQGDKFFIVSIENYPSNTTNNFDLSKDEPEIIENVKPNEAIYIGPQWQYAQLQHAIHGFEIDNLSNSWLWETSDGKPYRSKNRVKIQAHIASNAQENNSPISLLNAIGQKGWELAGYNKCVKMVNNSDKSRFQLRNDCKEVELETWTFKRPTQ